jgi:hypothetical protein
MERQGEGRLPFRKKEGHDSNTNGASPYKILLRNGEAHLYNVLSPPIQRAHHPNRF